GSLPRLLALGHAARAGPSELAAGATRSSHSSDRRSPSLSRPKVRHELAFLAMDEDVAGQVGEIPVLPAAAEQRVHGRIVEHGRVWSCAVAEHIDVRPA